MDFTTAVCWYVSSGPCATKQWNFLCCCILLQCFLFFFVCMFSWFLFVAGIVGVTSDFFPLCVQVCVCACVCACMSMSFLFITVLTILCILPVHRSTDSVLCILPVHRSTDSVLCILPVHHSTDYTVNTSCSLQYWLYTEHTWKKYVFMSWSWVQMAAGRMKQKTTKSIFSRFSRTEILHFGNLYKTFFFFFFF